MKITNKNVNVELTHECQMGDLKFTLVAMCYLSNPPVLDFDIDFADITDISFNGVEIEGYTNWQKFKTFHREMGIDYEILIQNQFKNIFTEEAVKKELSSLNINF